MFKSKAMFASFSVNKLAKAKEFYGDVLGLMADEDENMGLKLHLPDGGEVFVYQKDNHQAASFTILNFVVDDINKAVDELLASGVTFERYDGMSHDERGIVRGLVEKRGPDIAWFKDPAGNIVSVLQSE